MVSSPLHGKGEPQSLTRIEAMNLPDLSLIADPKVIHHRRGSLWKLAAADVNNFCEREILTCEQLCVALEKSVTQLG